MQEVIGSIPFTSTKISTNPVALFKTDGVKNQNFVPFV